MNSPPSAILWSPEFSVGVRSLDRQHRSIFAALGKLLAESDAGVRSEIVSETLNMLTRYASEHFREEERLMEQAHYPAVEEHKAEHRKFQEKIVECCLATSIGVSSIPRQLIQFLLDWITDHILNEDMKYKPFLAGRRTWK
jgi:hemerythrin